MLHSLHILFFTTSGSATMITLSLHDALPISTACHQRTADGGALYRNQEPAPGRGQPPDSVPVPDLSLAAGLAQDRKSTRLNSSHVRISYGVFCLKKKQPSIACTST